MPDFDAAGATIRSAFNTGFTAHPIAWPNAPFDPPKDGAGDPLPYVRFHILEADANIAGYGGNTQLYRHPGEVKVNVLVPDGQGDGLAREIGELVAAVFRGQTLSGIRFYAPSFRANGTEGAYWQATVTCRFEYDLTD